MGVPQFSGDVESLGQRKTVSLTTTRTPCMDSVPEVLRVFNGAVTKLDANASSLLEGLLQQDGLQDWVQLLTNILQ